MKNCWSPSFWSASIMFCICFNLFSFCCTAPWSRLMFVISFMLASSTLIILSSFTCWYTSVSSTTLLIWTANSWPLSASAYERYKFKFGNCFEQQKHTSTSCRVANRALRIVSYIAVLAVTPPRFFSVSARSSLSIWAFLASKTPFIMATASSQADCASWSKKSSP